jgi:hypothetical protein
MERLSYSIQCQRSESADKIKTLRSYLGDDKQIMVTVNEDNMNAVTLSLICSKVQADFIMSAESIVMVANKK